MDLMTLKEKLSEVQMNENKLRDQFKTELTALKDAARESVEDYLSKNAKYQSNEKVLRKANHSIPCHSWVRRSVDTGRRRTRYSPGDSRGKIIDY